MGQVPFDHETNGKVIQKFLAFFRILNFSPLNSVTLQSLGAPDLRKQVDLFEASCDFVLPSSLMFSFRNVMLP